MRPTYETAQSKEVERQMAIALAGLWCCDVVKLPIAYRLDYAAMRDKRITAWLELKRRYRNFADHDSVFLSLQKVLAAVELNGYSGLPCLFVVQCNDGFFYTNILKEFRTIEFRGRVDRNDWQDQEPITAIPNSEFTEIKFPPSAVAAE